MRNDRLEISTKPMAMCHELSDADCHRQTQQHQREKLRIQVQKHICSEGFEDNEYSM